MDETWRDEAIAEGWRPRKVGEFLRLDGGTLDIGLIYWKPKLWRRILFPSVRRQYREDQRRRESFLVAGREAFFEQADLRRPT